MDTNRAMKKLAQVLAALGKVKAGDRDVWCDQFYDALRERIVGVDSAEECVVFYLGIEYVERQVNNGGFAQLFLNADPQLIKWALGGYRMFKKPKSTAVLKRAMALAKKEEPALLAIRNLGGKAGIKAYVKYRALGTFTALEKQAAKDIGITARERIELVKKYKKDFAALATS